MLARLVEDYASIISLEANGEYRVLAFGSYTVRGRNQASICLAQLDDHYSIIIRVLSNRIYNRIHVDRGDLEDAHINREYVNEATTWLARYR